MAGRTTPVIALVVLIATALAGVAVASPPTDDENGLSANESATLWSRDDDSGYITNAEYHAVYGESRSAMAELANATDITFTRPPTTASTWSRNDHAEFDAGGVDSSIAPRGADRRDGRIIKDAHASVFSVSPATVLHESADERTLYVAPTGTVRGVVDYRLTLGDAANGSRLLSHRITDARLLADGQVVARSGGTHRPVLSYDVDPQVEQLTLEAVVAARFERPVNASVPNGSETEIVEETLTVRDSRTVEVYTLEPALRAARYPNGETGVALFQNGPWRGYSLGGDTEVRGVWRFYTARDTDWDELTIHSETGVERIASESIPVAVHAYPSQLGPQVRPTGSGTDLLQTWGTTNDPPVTLGEGILAEVVERPYETTWGVATRQKTVGESVTVYGIVRGTNATLSTDGAVREIREADLSLVVADRTDEQVTLVATLRDRETGEPLALGEGSGGPIAPEGDSERAGYLTVNGQVVQTNASGMASIQTSETGVYTTRYHPESWLSQGVAYAPATATARYHPLTTAEGWLWLLIDGVVWLSPLLLALVAGRTLSRLFTGTRYT